MLTSFFILTDSTLPYFGKSAYLTENEVCRSSESSASLRSKRLLLCPILSKSAIIQTFC